MLVGKWLDSWIRLTPGKAVRIEERLFARYTMKRDDWSS